MDDPSLLSGRSTYAKRRRKNRLNVCRCGAIMHNNDNCRSKVGSLVKMNRLEFVQKGRVVIEDETTSGALPGLVASTYHWIKFNIPEKVNKGANAPRHPSRSPEETPEYYVW
ncbi:RNA binding protein [Mint virus 2]|uniref:RNA binding protein n=1 Tax=Mint virus 2 TaxID=312998 RepID=Q52V11_9VIRU|nr:RNA binding protein [Mint virus 2]AAX07263.1 RNA binding protein [Mint virus 2]